LEKPVCSRKNKTVPLQTSEKVVPLQPYQISIVEGANAHLNVLLMKYRIVIPVWKNAAGLERTLPGIPVHRDDLEIVVVNDGADVEVSRIAGKWQKRFFRLGIPLTELKLAIRSGPSVARNRGAMPVIPHYCLHEKVKARIKLATNSTRQHRSNEYQKMPEQPIRLTNIHYPAHLQEKKTHADKVPGSFDFTNKSKQHSAGYRKIQRRSCPDTNASSPEWLIFLDDDLALPCGWLETMEMQTKHYDYICGDVVMGKGPCETDLEKLIRISTFRFTDYFAKQSYGPSGFLMVRRAIFEKIGGFDERLTACEDVILGQEIKQAGGKMYMLEWLTAVHSPKTLQQLIRDKIKYANGKHRLRELYTGQYGNSGIAKWKALMFPVVFVWKMLHSPSNKLRKECNLPFFRFLWAFLRFQLISCHVALRVLPNTVRR
jgi:glycosyltransferase involved in cell wall biosynthesis